MAAFLFWHFHFPLQIRIIYYFYQRKPSNVYQNEHFRYCIVPYDRRYGVLVVIVPPWFHSSFLDYTWSVGANAAEAHF
jgi:hypothetical protein